MSYIKASVVADAEVESIIDREADVDANLDNELLAFAIDLISKVEELREGEALVVWKDIF